MIGVYLISGFLGSGKTTFLNRLLKQAPTDLKLMVLMNEFGEEGIDGALIEDPDLELMEISRGSIFCACVKGDYIKGLYRIATVIKPEALVIEATGVADPRDLAKDLMNPIFKGEFNLKEKFCLVDAANFHEQYDIFTAVERQIESIDRFIINKIDETDAETIEKVKTKILEHNPNALFLETTYANIDFGSLFTSHDGSEIRVVSAPVEADILTEDELDRAVEQALEDQASNLAPPDNLVSLTCRWTGGSIDDFRVVADKLPDDVVRAKGFLFRNGESYLYSHVGHKYEITPFSGRLSDVSTNRVVFIRRRFASDDILQMFSLQGLEVTAGGSAFAASSPV